MNDSVLSRLEDPVVFEPAGTADASVIWLHGLGADGHDFEPLVPAFGEALTRGTRFVFPHAPMLPVTINGGMLMRAWYDIRETDISSRADADGVRASEGILRALVEREVAAGVPTRRIVLAGFSQGGAIALHTGLGYPEPLAGVLALSTYLPVQAGLEAHVEQANAGIPIFLGHGSQDPMVPMGLSEASRASLASLGYVVEVHTYPIAHSVCPEEVHDVADWLRRVLGIRQ